MIIYYIKIENINLKKYIIILKNVLYIIKKYYIYYMKYR